MMSSDPGAELLTTTDAGTRAGVSSRTIYKWQRAGLIAFREVNGRNLVDVASLDAYVRERNQKKKEAALRTLVETSEPGAEPGSELIIPDHSAPVAELAAEVRTLRQEVAELRAIEMFTEYNRPGWVALRRQEIPTEIEETPAPARSWWDRVRAWFLA